MTTFPGAARVIKGALISFNSPNPIPNVILFQFNPNQMTRTLQVQSAGDQTGDRSEALRLQGAPVENITLDVELDAADQLEKGRADAVKLGIQPQLSALELLIYPGSSLVITNTVLMAAGVLEIIPPTAPFTVFVWGIKRVLPVRLTKFSIAEQAFDPNLNPIQAKVSLGLRVLSYNDFSITHPGYHLFLAHQSIKEAMAFIGSTSNISEVAGGNFNLF